MLRNAGSGVVSACGHVCLVVLLLSWVVLLSIGLSVKPILILCLVMYCTSFLISPVFDVRYVLVLDCINIFYFCILP